MIDLTGAATKFVRAVYDPAIDAMRDARSGLAASIDDLARTERASADETAREVAEAWHAQPTIERSIVAGGWQLLENSVQRDLRRTGALAGVVGAAIEGGARVAFETSPLVQSARATAHVAAAGARGAVAAADEYARGARSIAERSAQARAEQLEHVGRAIGDAVESGRAGRARTNASVAEAWHEQPTIERRVVVGGWRLLTGRMHESVAQHVAAGNVVRAAGEAAVHDAKTGLQNVGDAIATNWRATGAFFGGLFGG